MEQIPIELYPSLNEYIRVGKRLISQHKLFLRKQDEALALKRKIFDEFIAYQRGDFHFKIYREDHFEISSFITLKWESPLWGSIPNWDLSIEEKNTYAEIFYEPLAYISDLMEHARNAKAYEYYANSERELREMIAEISRATAFTFFSYKLMLKEWNKFKDLYLKKCSIQAARYKKIKSLWKKTHPIIVGQKVIYWDSVGNEKTGTIMDIDAELSCAHIKSERGKKIFRTADRFSWKGKFELAQLNNAMLSLNNMKVPECWQENKVNFYE